MALFEIRHTNQRIQSFLRTPISATLRGLQRMAGVPHDAHRKLARPLSS